ncbi:hypothetical protein CMUS01_02530 [Colletotrichum musicola]|uniref:Uncharacterized protein n=1 Tax=Colletotrichum musicola TaxID=2175873 RepID=A0A8H6NUZ7_9PEZI|nr:hypothetical protein CMUS01_02530 [Colletotrichum musicola]
MSESALSTGGGWRGFKLMAGRRATFIDGIGITAHAPWEERTDDVTSPVRSEAQLTRATAKSRRNGKQHASVGGQTNPGGWTRRRAWGIVDRSAPSLAPPGMMRADVRGATDDGPDGLETGRMGAKVRTVPSPTEEAQLTATGPAPDESIHDPELGAMCRLSLGEALSPGSGWRRVDLGSKQTPSVAAGVVVFGTEAAQLRYTVRGHPLGALPPADE